MRQYPKRNRGAIELSSAGYSPNRLTDTSFALLQWLAYLTAEKRLSNEFADTIG